MTDTAHNQPMHVTAEEPHSALRKLARALIASTRMRQAEVLDGAEVGTQQSSSTDFPGAPEHQCGGLS